MNYLKTHVKSSIQTHGKVYVTVDFQYSFEENYRKEANKILRDYLKLARLTFKIMGGSAGYPILTAESAKEYVSDMRYVPASRFDKTIFADIYNKYEPASVITDVLPNKKVDPQSLLSVITPVFWGCQTKTNLFNRIKRHWQPLLILHLAGVKLEVPNI
jgi:hypothetical protein